MDRTFRSHLTVGISSRSPENNLKWLLDLLKNPKLQGLVSDVRYLPINNYNSSTWKKDVETCSIGILYHTDRQGRINITDISGAIYDKELDFMSKALGREKVIIVLDDLGETDEKEKQRILEAQPSIKRLSYELILIPKDQKQETLIEKFYSAMAACGGDIQQLLMSHFYNKDNIEKEPSRSSRLKHENLDHSQEADCHRRPHFQDLMCSTPQKLKVGLFSRSPQSNYCWLMSQLQSPSLGDVVEEVHGVFISNNYSKFSSSVSGCTFGILYHTLNHGRLNITDVKDSLYDKELQHLSCHLGKDNVIMVIDDLTDSSLERKTKILKEEPSIKRYAKETFLFTEEEKKQKKTIVEKLEEMKVILEMSSQALQVKLGATSSIKTSCNVSTASLPGRDHQQDSSDKGSVSRTTGSTNKTEDPVEQESSARLPLTSENRERSKYKEATKLMDTILAKQRNEAHSYLAMIQKEENVWNQIKALMETQEHIMAQQERRIQEQLHKNLENERIINKQEDTICRKENIIQEQQNRIKKQEFEFQALRTKLEDSEQTVRDMINMVPELGNPVHYTKRLEKALQMSKKEADEMKIIKEKEQGILAKEKELEEQRHEMQKKVCEIQNLKGRFQTFKN